MRKLFYILTLSLLFIEGISLQAQAIDQEATRQIIQEAEDLYGGHLAISIVRCSNDEQVFAYRPNERMTPASVMKVLSTGAALQIFGKGYRFPTYIYGTGRQKGQSYHGDIVIQGQGDPSIASNYIKGEEHRLSNEIVAELKKRGIKNINGRVVVNAYLSENQGAVKSWQLEDIGWYYGTGLYGFNYKDNKFCLRVNTKRRYHTRPTQIKWDKDLPIKVINQMRIGKREELLTYSIPKRTNAEVLLKGSVPRRKGFYPLSLANPNPALYAGRKVSKAIKQAGIKLKYQAQANYAPTKVKGKLLHCYYSKPIDTLALITNHRSHNLFAEGFAALVANGKESGKSLDEYWSNRLRLDEMNLVLADGSGLSRKDKVTAQTLTDILNDLLRKENPEGSSLLHSLPRVGKEGTVKNLLPSEEIEAYLKSGSMSGVVSYAGYVHHQGQWYAIALLSNDFNRNSNARKSIRSVLRSLFASDKTIN